jgi:hypothetical protein
MPIVASDSGFSMEQPKYNFRAIRNLLIAAFSDQELRQLCYDIQEFRDVLKEFSENMGRQKMAQLLVEYCERQVLLPLLLEVVKEEAPAQYAQFADSLIVGGEKPASPIPLDRTELLQTMIATKMRLLNELELQAAQYTPLHRPVELKIQIDNLKEEIAGLQEKLSASR